MERLSIGAENLLRDIIEHRNSNNMPDTAYWKNKFDHLDIDAEVVIRSQFKELTENRMISVFWADNVPAEIQILNNGWAYESDLQRQEKEKNDGHRNEFWRTLIVGVITAIIGVIVGKFM